MAADMATVEVAEQEEQAGDIFASFRPLTESPVFVGVQVGYVFLLREHARFFVSLRAFV